MKKLLLLLCVLFCGFAHAQIFTKPSNPYGIIANRYSFDSTLYFPTGCGNPTDTMSLFSQGNTGSAQKLKKSAIYFDSCGHTFWIYDPSTLSWIGVSASSFDTTSLSNRINLKLNIADTTLMLAPYLRLSVADGRYYPLLTNPAGYSVLPNVINQLQVVNDLNTPSIRTDIIANRPAPGVQGRLFIATDTHIIYTDEVSTWVAISSANAPNNGQLTTWNISTGAVDFGGDATQNISGNLHNHSFSLDSINELFLRANLIDGSSFLDAFDTTLQLHAEDITGSIATSLFVTPNGIKLFPQGTTGASPGYVWTLDDPTTGAGTWELNGGGAAGIDVVLGIGDTAFGKAMYITNGGGTIVYETFGQNFFQAVGTNQDSSGISITNSTIELVARGGLLFQGSHGTSTTGINLITQASDFTNDITAFPNTGNLSDTLATLFDLRSLGAFGLDATLAAGDVANGKIMVLNDAAGDSWFDFDPVTPSLSLGDIAGATGGGEYIVMNSFNALQIHSFTGLSLQLNAIGIGTSQTVLFSQLAHNDFGGTSLYLPNTHNANDTLVTFFDLRSLSFVSSNIYTANGSLLANRTLTLNSNTLSFVGTATTTKWTSDGILNLTTSSGSESKSIIITNTTAGGTDSAIKLFGDVMTIAFYIGHPNTGGGFAGTSYSDSAGNLLGAVGYDYPNSQKIYLADMRGVTTGASIEQNGSVFAWFDRSTLSFEAGVQGFSTPHNPLHNNVAINSYGSIYARDSAFIGKVPTGTTTDKIALYRSSDSALFSISVLPVQLGGTNLSSYTTGGILLATGTTTLAQISLPAHAGMKLTSTSTTTYAWQDTTVGGAGTVTSIATGIGLSGGTITTSGTLIADTNYLIRYNDTTGHGTNNIATRTYVNSLGFITSNQTITLSGNVTGSGTTTITTTIASLAVTNSMIANSTIDLTAKVTGVLPLANGGTNNATWTAGQMVYATSTTAFAGITAPAHTGMKLTSTGVNSFAWQDTTAGGGGSVASPATSIQFNNAGSFGGSANNVWDNTNLIQTITTPTTANTYYPSFIAQNTATASTGNQMYGGFFYSIGRGWKTTATAASYTNGYRWGTFPNQAALPSSIYVLQSSLEGTQYENVLSIETDSTANGKAVTAIFGARANTGEGTHVTIGAFASSNSNGITVSDNTTAQAASAIFSYNTASGEARIGGVNGSGGDYTTFYSQNVEVFRASTTNHNLLIGSTTDHSGSKLQVTGIVYNSGMLTATGTPTVVMHNADSTYSQLTLATLATKIPTATGVVASADLTAQSATNSSVATVTPAANGTFRVGVYTAITAISAGTLTITATYTDETSASRTITFVAMGQTVAGLTAIGETSFPNVDIRAKSGSAITVVSTFTGTSITYDVGATITQLR